MLARNSVSTCQKHLRAKGSEDGGQEIEPPCQDGEARIVLEVTQLANNLREDIVGRIIVVTCIVSISHGERRQV